MSYQEDRFGEIADAVRRVKGTTGTVKATNFATEVNNMAKLTVVLTPTWANTGLVPIAAKVIVKRGNTVLKTIDRQVSSVVVCRVNGCRKGDTVSVESTNTEPSSAMYVFAGDNSLTKVPLVYRVPQIITLQDGGTLVYVSRRGISYEVV